MSISARDKKILVLLVPVAVLLGFWFLILTPKRSEAERLGTELTAVEQKRDAAVTSAGQLGRARNSYAKDYETVVRLGKAVPASLDMPSLLVQLDSAAKGTGIAFDSIKAGERTTAPAPAATPAPGGASGGPPPVAAGGTPAQTGPGQTTEKASNAKASSDQSSSAAGATSAGGSAPTPAPTGSAASPSPGAPTAATAPGLDSVPLDFSFTGSFFDLADFFHRMKRFVRVTNDKIKVQGRLMTIDSLDFKATDFPKLNATVTATVYLSPKSEGATAGGTASGPQGAPTPASAPTPPPAAGAAPAAATPTSSSSSGGVAQ